MDEVAPRGPGLEPALRRIEALPFGRVWLALSLWLAILALQVGWSALFGDLESLRRSGGLPPPMRTSAVIALVIAFVFAVHRWELRASLAEWGPLRPLTRLSPEAFRYLVEGDAARAARAPLAVDLVGAALGVAVVMLSTAHSELRGEGWSASLVWALGANAVLFAMLLRAVRSSFLGRRQARRLADALVELDLLDTSPLQCFARQGLRRAFYWAGGSSISALLALDLERTWPLVVIVTATLGLASLALVSPVRFAAQRIHRAKRAELARTRERIRAARDALLSGEAAGERLPGLLAWEERIQAVGEWPFDAPTLLRFAALALLASGSWLGGALVERLLSLALD